MRGIEFFSSATAGAGAGETPSAEESKIVAAAKDIFTERKKFELVAKHFAGLLAKKTEGSVTVEASTPFFMYLLINGFLASKNLSFEQIENYSTTNKLFSEDSLRAAIAYDHHERNCPEPGFPYIPTENFADARQIFCDTPRVKIAASSRLAPIQEVPEEDESETDQSKDRAFNRLNSQIHA